MSNGKTKVEETKVEETKEFFVVRTVKKVADTCKDTVNRYNEKYVKKTVDSGKELSEKVKTNARKALDTAVEKGKKIVPDVKELTIVKKAEEGLNNGMDAIRGKINLPSRTDIETLTLAMENLDRKMDAVVEKRAA
ncbi:hypothetical protein QUF76_00430 [Desulfobacterales bacterium HSG16]|nr:hypothetical protein [Desulfobacterales bacterium HSG16]